MNIFDITNLSSRNQARSDPNVALLIVHPEERLDVAAMLEVGKGLEIVHREPGLNEDTMLFVRCDDEEEKEGLERAWMSFRRFRRALAPGRGSKT